MTRITRIVLASLVSLGVILGIYTSVQGASLNMHRETAGAHQVSGVMTNLDHYRVAQPNLNLNQIYQQGAGHGCNRARKFDQGAVAHQLDDPARMGVDVWIDKFASQCL